MIFSHIMGRFPFSIRPIKLDESVVRTEPISLPNDMSGKVTLSSKHASIHLDEFTKTLQTKDVAEIIGKKPNEEIILSTNTILELARAKDIDETDPENRFWPMYLLCGFLVGITLLAVLHKNISLLFIAVAGASVVLGFMGGFVGKKFYEAKLKKGFQEWVKQFLEE